MEGMRNRQNRTEYAFFWETFGGKSYAAARAGRGWLPAISYPESSGSMVSGLVARRDSGEMEFFQFFLIGYSGNNEIGEAEGGSMLTPVDAAVHHAADLSGNKCDILERLTGHAPGS